MKRIVICADGTWNRPERNIEEDYPTNVLKIARAIAPFGNSGVAQQVFYDWGIGSYHDKLAGGITGAGIHKNIKDNYRYIVQNYSEGDELYFFGFSRGAYTVRSLCGLINNCGVLKRPDARLIEKAFAIYKNQGAAYKPKASKAVEFKEAYAYASVKIKFVGVWDTVGAFGIPFSFLGLFDNKDEFYDNKMGANIEVARHALAIDEQRSDFEPTIWRYRQGVDLKQVWFAGVHSDIGGSYAPDKNGESLADISLKWLIGEAEKLGLEVEDYLQGVLKPNPLSTIHQSRKHIYRLKERLYRDIDYRNKEEKKNNEKVFIHHSVKTRWEHDSKYRPRKLKEYINKYGWINIEH